MWVPREVHRSFRASSNLVRFIASLNMVSTWYKLVPPRFKEKRQRSLLCCSGECQKFWKYANQQNPLLGSNYIIPPKCKRYFLFLKSSRRSHQFDTRFRFEVLFLLQMMFLKLYFLQLSCLDLVPLNLKTCELRESWYTKTEQAEDTH